MKTLKLITRFIHISLIAMAATLAQSCQDDNETNLSEQEELEAAEYSTLADNTFDDESEMFDEVIGDENAGGRKKTDPCATVTRDEVAKTITIDFKDGCVGPYGRKRSGKIIIKYSGTFGDNTANRIITFENFYVNNRKITGQVELRDFNRNADGNLTATRKLVDYTVTFPNGKSIELNGSTTREWIAGEGDDIAGNEVIRITGSYEGSTSRGRSFTRTIIEPVIADFNCRTSGGFLRVAGSHELTWKNLKKSGSRIVNYGTGECDNEITVTINGKSHTITVNE
jgi:hypothetical protein